MTTYLSQGIDYIGFLNGKLRDLQGYATLAHELIQNADDARATTMVFDVRDEALVVENNRLFTDCGAVTEDACPWKAQPDIGHRCDFHRFRNVASADKRTQESTTGAFGIGFISVYQITDRPELRSGQHHWRLTPDAPENQRIEALPDDGTRNAGTQFVLPWAIDSESQLRKRLHLQSVQVEQVIPALMDVFSQTLPKAILFLKHLNEIELRQNGQLIKRIGRTTEDGQILVQDGDQLRLWTVLRGSFDSDAATLRQQYPLQIETKRTADVAVAIAEETSNFRGVFSAWLPTEQSTELPFHINADFYPSTDRKRILLTEDHQGAWNRAAIQTAAALVADAIPELPRSLEPVELWSLFKRLKEVSESAEKGSPDPVYTSFWRRAQPVIIATPSVITSTRAWYPPAEVFLLEDADEEANLSLLEQMGLQIVHPDLRRFYTLFRSIGIRLLGLADIARALQSAGLTQSLALEQAPEWIRAPDARAQLAHEIGIVSKQNLKQETLENARRSLCQCAIALTRTGLFAPPAQLYRPTRDILGAFAALDLEGRLAAEENPAGIAQLVAEIQLESMLTILEPFAKKAFEQLWIEQKELLLSLIDWFVDHRKPLLTDHTLKQRLKQLPIWPSERTVHPLDDLVVAGSFQDPLHLASVLSHAVYHTRRDFMSELGFQRLNISTYASNLIPKAFTQGKVSPPVCDQLVLILAEHFGQLRDSQAVRVALEGCPLVACKDGVYRAPKEVYFDSNAVTDVFADLPVALVPSERQESVMLLYEWLGVAHEPRLTDVVVRIQQIVARPPDTRGRHSISELFRHLSNRKIMPEEPAIAALRVLRWLPARNDETRWFAPGEIYAVYSDYLFTTQANFLALDRHLQGSARTLIELLGIKDNPSTLQVVKHLQACAAHSQPVNREVYTFLNDHAQDPEIERLRNAACLLLDNNRYVFPSQVFWGEHGFGRYRYRLDHHYRRYDRLLTRLGVRELPQPSDAVAVMKEIAGAFQQAQVPLDEETYNVLIACWRQLGEALEQGNIPQNYLSKLRDYPLVPTEDRLLCPPTEMFLEDRSGIAERLHATDRRLSFKKQHTIARIVGAWQAMEAAGVRALSKAVKVTLIECEDRAPANDLQQKLSERKVLIRRVIEAHASDDQQWDLSLLDTLQVDSVSNLALDYSIRIAERSWLSDPEEVAAYFDADYNVLYVQRQSNLLWFALARELAFALSLEGESVHLAASLKEILSADSFEIAAEVLNELGYAQLVDTTSVDVSVGTVGLGGETAPDDDTSPVDEPAPSATDTSTIATATTAGTGNTGSGVEQPTTTSSQDGQTGGAAATRPTPTSTNGGVAGATSPTSTSTNGGAAGATSGTGGNGGARTDAGAGAADRTHGTNAGSSDRERGRLRTYVTPAREGDASDRAKPTADVSAVDRAGIARVLKFEQEAGRFPVEMPHENPGYDIESRDAGGAVLRYIEVKSISGDWDSLGVALSSRQFNTAHLYNEQFWLYVVERAEQADARVYPIQDPARRVNQFFYDDGWRSVADDQPVVLPGAE